MCINKPLKGVLRNFWEDYVAKIITNLTETEQQRKSFKLLSPSRQDIIVNLIAEGINDLKNHPDMIENSFQVCGITTDDPGKIRNVESLKKIMNSVKDKLADEE